MSDLLHNLIRQQAALQLAFRQKDWDLLIPVYFGNMDQAFDPSRLSAILIQVKNRVQPSKLSAIVDFKQYSRFFSHTRDPILYILMDFGTPKADCSATGWAKQHYIFGIHAIGADVGTFACLEGVREAAQMLRKHVVPNGSDTRKEHNEACQRNVRFRYHDWKSRFPVIRGENLQQQPSELGGNDTFMSGTD